MKQSSLTAKLLQARHRFRKPALPSSLAVRSAGKRRLVHGLFAALVVVLAGAGKATIRYEFAYDGGRPGSGGKGALFVNGAKVAEGKIEQTVPFAFSADETADVGVDEATPVTEDYAQGNNRFTGRIRSVTLELK